MKKIKKRKLSLDREAIRDLSARHLGMAAGGLSITGSAAPTFTCVQTNCDPTTVAYTHCRCPSTIDPSITPTDCRC